MFEIRRERKPTNPFGPTAPAPYSSNRGDGLNVHGISATVPGQGLKKYVLFKGKRCLCSWREKTCIPTRAFWGSWLKLGAFGRKYGFWVFWGGGRQTNIEYKKRWTKKGNTKPVFFPTLHSWRVLHNQCMMPTGMNDSTKFPFVAFRRQEKEFYKQAATPTDSRCASSEVESVFWKTFRSVLSTLFLMLFSLIFWYPLFSLFLHYNLLKAGCGAMQALREMAPERGGYSFRTLAIPFSYIIHWNA